MKKLLPLLLLAAQAISYELAICGIFHNDAKYLEEWIDFHVKQGVEHFYLYNHFSTDNYLKVLEPYGSLITLTDWPYAYDNYADWLAIQCRAYTDCVKRYRNQNNWVAFLDTDEFLFSTDFRSLPTVLEEYKDYGAVSVHWACYGTSQTSVPEGEGLLEHLVMRGPLNFIYNEMFKTIAQVKYVSGLSNPHTCIMKRGHIIVDENKVDTHKSSVSKNISFDKLRINHYWSRDLDYFYQVKIPRQQQWNDPSEEYRNGRIQIEKEMNQVYDPILIDWKTK